MPPYDFGTSEDWLRKLFPNYQSQAQPQQSGADIANAATVDGLQQKINEQAQAQQAAQQQQIAQAQQQSFLDPVARRQYLPKILASKEMYDKAGNPALQQQLGLNEQQIREKANASANEWREAASNAGFDLSQYGAGVSLNDAYQNLATNDARAVVDLAQGKYSMTADQYYLRQYDELLKKGHSANKAKYIASNRAMKYKGDRVSYLNGMINGYGFEGSIVTPIGRQIIADLISEEPQMASYYVNLQDKALSHENALTQTALSNQGMMDRLMQEYSNSSKARAETYNYQTMGAYRDAAIQGNRDMANAKQQRADMLWAQSQQEEAEDRAYNRKLGHAIDMANFMKLQGDEWINSVVTSLGYPSKAKPTENKNIDKLKEYHKQLSDNYGMLMKYITDSSIPEEQRNLLNLQVADIQEKLNLVEERYTKELGLEDTAPTFDEYAETDDQKNIATVAKILQWGTEQGATEEQQNQVVRNWLPKNKDKYYTDYLIAQARALIGGAKSK